jgi:creatinine amidohydrolase
MFFEKLKWTELGGVRDRVFVVPLGSLEQHGPHLPLATDSWIVGEIARRLESRMHDELVLLPTQWLGHSPHHRKFGCVSLGMRPYMDLIGGLCHSLVSLGARRIFLLNGHGGNDVPVRAALREVKDTFAEMPDLYVAFASYWNLAAKEFNGIRQSPKGGMGHACEMETSVMLALHPEDVDMSKAVSDGLRTESQWLQSDMLSGTAHYLVNDFDELSRSGVVGMPESATPEKGELFLGAAVDAASAFLHDFRSWQYQER